jgi:carbon monoxide dehydrogenase subunit G
MSVLSRLLLLFCLSGVLPALAAPAADDDIDVKVSIDGDNISTDASFLIDAKPREVWSVLTDFEHMADFVSNLSSSKVVSRSRNQVTVEQKGKAGIGPVSFAFDSVREIQLSPFEWIRSHMVSGNMKKFDGVTRFSDEGGKTRISYHADAVSDTWIPPVVGKGFIEDQTREQFAQMRKEIARRKVTEASR